MTSSCNVILDDYIDDYLEKKDCTWIVYYRMTIQNILFLLWHLQRCPQELLNCYSRSRHEYSCVLLFLVSPGDRHCFRSTDPSRIVHSPARENRFSSTNRFVAHRLRGEEYSARKDSPPLKRRESELAVGSYSIRLFPLFACCRLTNVRL